MNLTSEYQRLSDLNTEFDDLFESAEDLILIENVRLNDALKNQLKLQLNWERFVNKVNFFYSTCEELVDNAHSSAFRKEMKDTYVDVSVNEAKEYAKADQDYREARALFNKARHLRDEARGVLETITSRKYILNNITNAKVASVDNDIL